MRDGAAGWCCAGGAVLVGAVLVRTVLVGAVLDNLKSDVTWHARGPPGRDRRL